ncbi:hypothetical protein D3C80_1267230 [compost metagenome]
MRQTFVFRTHGVVQPINILDVVSPLSSGGQILIFTDRRVQFSKNAAIINQQAKLFQWMQSVHPGNSLDKIMGFKRLIDIQHGIFRFIKPGEQFINDDQQFKLIIGIETANDIAGIHRLILRADIILPPFRHFRQFAFIHLGVPFTGIRRADHHR